MATNKRKQDEKHLKLLREMVSLPSNKTCFDCHQRGPTYVNMTIGSFICTSCSGIMRGLNPPHRVKSISMASFTPDEMEFLKSHGNELNRKVYLGLYDSRLWPEPDSRDEQKVRDYMVQKYENKRWYVAPTDAMKEDAKRANEAALNSKPQTKPLRSLLGDSTPKLVVGGGSQPAASQSQPAPVRAPPTTSAPPSQLPAPAAVAKPSSGFDLLSDLGNSDPFASANTAPATIDNGFADFSNFGNFNNTPSQPISQPQPPQPQQQQQQQHHQQQPPVQSAVPAATTPFMSSTPLVPLGSNAAAPVSSQASQTSSNSTSTFSAISDRYAALADLDSAFSTPTTTATSINWGGMESGGPINWGGSTSATAQPTQPSSSIQWSGIGGGGNAAINWNNPAPAASASAEAPAQPAGFGVASTGHPGNPFLTQMAANPFGSAPGMPAFSSSGTTPNPFGGNVPSSMSTPFSQPASSAAPGFGAQFPAQTQQAGFGQFPVQNGGFGVAGAYGQSGAGFVQQQPQQQFMMAPQQQQQQPGGWGHMGASQAGQPVVNPFMNTAMQAPQVPPPSGATNPFL